MTTDESKYSSLFRVIGNVTDCDAYRLGVLKDSVAKLTSMETARLYMSNCAHSYKIDILEIPKARFGSMSFRVGVKDGIYTNVVFYLKSIEHFTKKQINNKKERR